MADHAFRISGLRHLRSQAGVGFELRVPELGLRPGEFAALVGPSGCGKSTLLDILGLVMKPLEVGVFSMAGPDRVLDLSGLDDRGRARIRSRHLGYVLQTGGLLPFLTVGQNIALPLRLNGRPDPGAVVRIARALGIEDQLEKRPRFLSGGQRQRVAIARALVHNPCIVLADEPTAAVDELTAKEIRNQFQALSRDLRTTTVMVTHDKSLIRGVVDRLFTFSLARPRTHLTVATLEEADLI